MIAQHGAVGGVLGRVEIIRESPGDGTRPLACGARFTGPLLAKTLLRLERGEHKEFVEEWKYLHRNRRGPRRAPMLRWLG